MYAAVPRIMPACVIAGVVIVGDCDTLGRRRGRRLQRLGQPEVEHLHGAVRPHLDVRGLQIAVDDALLVRGFERLGDLLARSAAPHQPESVPRAIRSASVGPSTSSITSARPPAGSLDPVDRRDIRMVQRREDCGLALEPGEPLGVLCELFGQHLDRDVASQARVGGAIDLAHAAHAEWGDDLVRAEASAGGQRHSGDSTRLRRGGGAGRIVFVVIFIVAVAAIVGLAHTAPFPFLLEAFRPSKSVWHVTPAPGAPPSIYLTFDDGPNPDWTPPLLDALHETGARATFFLIDAHVTDETAAIVKRIADEGTRSAFIAELAA